MYGHLPEWFTGKTVPETAQYYFDQLKGMAGVKSADEVESDLSGGLDDY